MKILIQSPRIVNTASPFHLKKKNVLIANGRIAQSIVATDISNHCRRAVRI